MLFDFHDKWQHLVGEFRICIPYLPSEIWHDFSCHGELGAWLSSLRAQPQHGEEAAAHTMPIREALGVDPCAVVSVSLFLTCQAHWNSAAIITHCPTLSPSSALKPRSPSQLAWPLKESGISSNISILSCPSPLFLTLARPIFSPLPDKEDRRTEHPGRRYLRQASCHLMRNLLLHRWPALAGSMVVFSSVASHPPASLAHGPTKRRSRPRSLPACSWRGEQSRRGGIQLPAHRIQGWTRRSPFPSPASFAFEA